MRNSKKLLSLIACLSLLSSCNKKNISSSLCPVTDSTLTTVNPTPEPVPTKTVEELNKELFENYAIVENNTVGDTGGLRLLGFQENIPEEYLNLDTLIIPETINENNLTALATIDNGLFGKFSKVEIIKLSKTISSISLMSSNEQSSPFTFLPNLKNIIVDPDNQYYEVPETEDGKSSNLLFAKDGKWIVCGWKDVIIPEKITSITSNAFNSNLSVTSITLHSQVNYIHKTSFQYIDNLTKIDLNGNGRYKIDKNTNILYSGSTIYAAWGEVTIPDSITSLSLDGFSSVTKVTLHEGVTTLPDNAFRSTKITSLDIPASVTSISQSAFNGLTEITNITIGEGSPYESSKSVILLKESYGLIYAFGDAILPDDKTAYAGTNFEYCYSLTSLTVTNNITFADINSFSKIPTGKSKTLNFKGNVIDFKNRRLTSSIVSSSEPTLYDLFKKYTSVTVNFLKDDGSNTWSTIEETHIMSELENL